MAEMERYGQLDAHDRVLSTVPTAHTIALKCLTLVSKLRVFFLALLLLVMH